ncbi:EAL domain-containing protein [Serpentinicella sp. ANB-PHB4]|uniref:bifunctional diguanylate cyclase/phosphodiesterase n=1 Tax=Serpentinicella sp. ANB-PHB4 TaxID=3074076 RepID=UPI00285946F2|nr:EAL domain-containing protein [Serpentinicella sp. ANB-PHB4]MDR5658436.1 EAL domain-containing protein [Serpentinicella sp. ANB-PHB4]
MINNRKTKINKKASPQEKDTSISNIIERNQFILEGTNDGIWDWNLQNGEYFFSSKEETVSQPSRKIDSLEGWKNLLHPEDKVKAVNILEDYLVKKVGIYQNIYRIKKSDKEYRWVLSRGRIQMDQSGKPLRIAGLHIDITEEMESKNKMNQQLYQLAYYDPLTDLPNKAKLNVEFEAMYDLNKSDQKVAIFYIDLDNFRYINNLVGYELGNEVIKNISKKLKEKLNKKFVLGRDSEEEFILLLFYDHERDLYKEANEVLKIFRYNQFLTGHQICITASIGIALCPEHAPTFNGLLEYADTALYYAKIKGKNQFRIYQESMREFAYKETSYMHDINEALQTEAFCMYYQPILETVKEELVGFEALIRWNDAQRGFISPCEFIPIAEKTGQILQLEKQIFEAVFKQVEHWKKQTNKRFFVSINLSPKGLINKGLVSFLEALVKKYYVEPSDIILEITETTLLEGIEETLAVFDLLKQKGFIIALDDFGTGYSSLNYLKELPISKLKLDKSFIDSLLVSEKDQYITESIIELCHRMNLKVVAEGVECEEQRDILLKLNCDLMQGYFYCKPKPVAELGSWIK